MRRFIFFYILYISLILTSDAQCALLGINNSSTTTSNTSIGTIAWNNTNNAFLSDNTYSTASALVLGNNTNYLVATNFGFSVPSYAIICGITIQVERSASGLLQNVSDNSVKIVKNGVISGNEKALGATWPSSDGIATYGNSSDLWGNTWTPADINASNFGVAISANLSGIAVLPTASIDYIRVTIHTDNSLPISLVYFDVTCVENKDALIYWATASENNNNIFTIEESKDAMVWDNLIDIEGAGNSTNFIKYSYLNKDKSDEINYYRLKQTDFDENYSYSNIVAVNCLNPSFDFKVFPNPTQGLLYVESDNQGILNIYDNMGSLIYSMEIREGITELDFSFLKSNLYSYVFINISGYKTGKIELINK